MKYIYTFLVVISFASACSAPPDNYHYVQTRVFIEEAQFQRDEALKLEAEIRNNNQKLLKLTHPKKANAIPMH